MLELFLVSTQSAIAGKLIHYVCMVVSATSVRRDSPFTSEMLTKYSPQDNAQRIVSRHEERRARRHVFPDSDEDSVTVLTGDSTDQSTAYVL
jgi:hypothetical protein